MTTQEELKTYLKAGQKVYIYTINHTLDNREILYIGENFIEIEANTTGNTLLVFYSQILLIEII